MKAPLRLAKLIQDNFNRLTAERIADPEQREQVRQIYKDAVVEALLEYSNRNWEEQANADVRTGMRHLWRSSSSDLEDF